MGGVLERGWKNGRVIAVLVLIAGVLAGSACGQGFDITADLVGTNFYLEYTAATDFYYRVQSSPTLMAEVWAVRDMRLGEDTTQSWEDVGVLISSILGVHTQAQFYRVGRIWLTNSLDYDGDGLGDAYELAHAGVDPNDPDSDRDGVTDGDEINFFGTSPSSPYSGASVYYTFDTNLQEWSSVDWGDAGSSHISWTNTGEPVGGSVAVTLAGDADITYAKLYLKGNMISDQNIVARPIYQAHIYVPSNAPSPASPNSDKVRVKLCLSSDGDGWTKHLSSLVFPQRGQWTELVWDASSLSGDVLKNVDEWGLEVNWNPSNWNGVLQFDTVYQLPYLPATNEAPGIISVTPLTNTVGRYEKFELTVGLTNVAGLNPYDPGDVNLEATFVSPSNETWTIWGFYMEEEGAAYGEGEWKVRFAPDEVGTWEYSVKVSNANGTNWSGTSTFSCVASDRHGWLRVSDNNGHYLEHDDDTPFIGIGYCHCWDGDDEGIFINAREHGINMLHWWMAPWDTLLTVEPAKDSYTWRERSTFYTYEQGRAVELDRIVEYAEKYGVKFVFTIWPHDALRDFNYHKWRLNGSWQACFTDNPIGMTNKVSEPAWFINTFSKIDDPSHNQKFFYDDTYKHYQEQLYRYIIARWGYSEAIGCWALASEMFGTFANSLNCINYQDPPGWVTAAGDFDGENPFYNMSTSQCDGKDYTLSWLNSINSYFKTNDPFAHPTTASYATDEYWDSGFPMVDIAQVHTYSDLYNWITPPVTLNKYHGHLRAEYDKPVFMGEIGTVDWKYYEPDYLRVTAWPGLCTGGAITPMMWTTPAFSWFGDAKMGPWTWRMSDEMKVLADFAADIEFHRLGLEQADVETKAAGEPAVTLIESFEGGLHDWSKWGTGVTSIANSGEHATRGSYSLLMDVDMDTYASMPDPASGIEKYEGDGFSYDWTNYWPYGTFKMDLYIPEFYHPEDNPAGFLLGINKDPRSIIEVHCRDAGNNWRYYSTTNEYAADGGWKKLTVGMQWNLELQLDVIPTEYEAAHITGLKFWFGDIGILRGPVWIDNMTVGRYAFNTYGMISSNGQFAFAWIQDRRWTNSLTAANAAFRLNGLDPGVFNLEWWNTLDGPVSSVNASAPTGTLSVTVPDFIKDIAVKIRRVGGIGATVHDVAIGNVQEFDWVVQSATQTIDVLVMNQGTAGETTDVTLADSTDGVVLGTNSVSISAGSNTTTTFTWNNTNATMGVTHTFIARAATVAWETETNDNTLSGNIRLYAETPPWDSCDRLRRWKYNGDDSDGRSLVVQTNMTYVTEETHSFAFYHRSPSKYQAYFGYDNVYENWSNKSAFVYDVYVADNSTNAQLLMRTGAGWDWYYSKEMGISSGWNTNLTYYFHSNDWTHAVWNEGTGSNDYYYNVPAGGLEEMQQIYLKVSGYPSDGTVYVDNIRVVE